LLVISC